MRGYDNPRFNHEMLLDLQFCEGTGTVTLDWAKAHHAGATLTGAPAWTNAANDLTFLDFDLGPPRDYIVISTANSGDLDFTTGAFSGAVWYYPQAGGNRYVFNKGTNVTGWCFYLNTSNRMSLGTRQAADDQYTTGPVLTLNVWHFVGFTRTGDTARVYQNGLDATYSAATHIDPDAAAQNFYIGCTDAVGAGWMEGYLWRPRIWGRCLTAAEMLAIYEIERGLFGV